MARSKYPISREFFPFNMFTPPMSPTFVRLAQRAMMGRRIDYMRQKFYE